MIARSRTIRTVVALFGVAALAAPASAVTYEILIENLIPGGMATGNPFTPPVAAVHDGTYSLFAPGGKATAGLELLAEDGDPTLLAGEAMGHGGVEAVEVGGGPFFDMLTMSIEGEPGDLLSLVTMLARSNDLITGVHDIALPESDDVVMMTMAYDAGTEENTGLVAHIPFYGNALVGPDEANPIAMINAYSVLDDPGGQIDYTFPPVARITITPKPSTPVEDASWSSIKQHFGR